MAASGWPDGPWPRAISSPRPSLRNFRPSTGLTKRNCSCRFSRCRPVPRWTRVSLWEIAMFMGCARDSIRRIARRSRGFWDPREAGVLYVNRRTGATTGAWPGVQSFCGWKGSGVDGKGGLGPFTIPRYMREQSLTIMRGGMSASPSRLGEKGDRGYKSAREWENLFFDGPALQIVLVAFMLRRTFVRGAPRIPRAKSDPASLKSGEECVNERYAARRTEHAARACASWGSLPRRACLRPGRAERPNCSARPKPSATITCSELARARAKKPFVEEKIDAAARPRQSHLRPVSRHPLQSGQVDLEGPAARLLLRPVPFRLLLHIAGRHLHRRRRRAGEAQLRPRSLHLRSAGAAAHGRCRSALCRLPAALSDQQQGLQRRVLRVPGRVLFPRHRQGPSLWAFGARSCDRYGPAQWRGVSVLPLLLDHARRRPMRSRSWCWALLDSPSATGAYRFTIKPGAATQMDVEMTIFPRRDLEHVGIAPLTSMFLYDAMNHRSLRRLSSGGARFRRSDDADRGGRISVAAARQSEDLAGQRLRRQQSRRLRPDAAQAPLSTTSSISKPNMRSGRACGWSRSAIGARVRSSFMRFPRSARSTTISPSSGSPSSGRAKDSSVSFVYRLYWCDEWPADRKEFKAMARFSGGGLNFDQN